MLRFTPRARPLTYTDETRLRPNGCENLSETSPVLIGAAMVVTVALAYGAIVFTSDPDDIKHLGAAADIKPGLVVRRV